MKRKESVCKVKQLATIHNKNRKKQKGQCYLGDLMRPQNDKTLMKG